MFDKSRNGWVVLGLLGALAACQNSSELETIENVEPIVQEEQPGDAFVFSVNEQLKELVTEVNQAAWVYNIHITPDTQAIYQRAQTKWLTFAGQMARAAKQYNPQNESAATARGLKLIRLMSSQPSPEDPDKTARLAELSAELEAAYATSEVCVSSKDCLKIDGINQRMAKSRNPDEMRSLWLAWHEQAEPQKDNYVELVSLMNEGARELGFADVGVLWRSGYDMPASQVDDWVSDMWRELKPLYEGLHCHVRAKLNEEYGDDVVPAEALIPAHLLGNMWAQDWTGIYDLVAPFPDESSVIDISKPLKAQQWTPVDMYRSGEQFFTSIGFPELPDSFYERSMFVQPVDRDAVCHASAWHIDLDEDVRIKVCGEVDQTNLRTAYHELGHIYYNLAYRDQTPIFQGGANDGFHEAIGDTILLSMTPDYYVQQGWLQPTIDFDALEQQVINRQMHMALERVAFLPFGRLVDEWRWQVFAGDVTPDNYSQQWAHLRAEYQGLRTPGRRNSDTFDPGAKYHVVANTPYLRYFLSFVLQFEFHQALCDAAGYRGPLHGCSIANSKAAGEQLQSMLALGASQPWPEALKQLTGRDRMSTQAMLSYFAPLQDWLDRENQGRICGW